MPGADVVCVQCCKSAVRALDTVKGMVVFCELESLPMCSLHHLSMRWMVPSPGGDERQTTDEDDGQLCQLWCEPGILMGSPDR